MNIMFECDRITLTNNEDGTIAVRANLTSWQDSYGLLRSIVKAVGAEHVKRLLDTELKEKEESN